MNDADFQRVPLARIIEPSHQLRERIDPDQLGALADSIATSGLMQPIGVRGPDADDRFEIVYGHRRYLACQLLRWSEIDARVFPADFDPLLASVAENLHRHDLNPVEEAHAVKSFLDRGCSRVEIARLFRRSIGWVEQRLALLDLQPDLLDAIRTHGLPLAVAAQLRDVDHLAYRAQLVYQAVTDGATAQTVAVWRAHYLADRERIVTNQLKVEEIIAEREKYVIRYPCDWCDDERPYRETRTVRLCLDCAQQLAHAKDAAAAGSTRT